MILIVLALVVYLLFTALSEKNEVDISMLPPRYLSQMDKCEEYGGIIEREDKNIGSWQELEQWRCVCEAGQIFDVQDNLSCNEWYIPQK
jgi:hypothetical protein